MTVSREIPKKVAIHTFGCRLNFSETGSIAKGFATRGYEIVPFGENADVVFINTCTVTDDADSSARNIIRKAVKTSPNGKVVVSGCYAQMDPEELAKLHGVDLILGTHEKYKVFDYLDEEDSQKIHIDESNEFFGAATSLEDGHTRAFLKIQDGCNYICSFCIIPFARGRSRTISIEEAKKQGQELIRDGFKEIVLTGVNIGEFERSSGEKLSDLVTEILNLEDLKRLRMSSVESNTITKELLSALKSSEKFLNHFHIPLQSGDDEVLKKMRRKYNSQEYRQTISLIKEFFPDCSIGADVIVGFPGETDEQFENTYNLLKELPITHFHVFPYSKRKNTTAAKLDNHISSQVKKERSKKLRDLGKRKLTQYSFDKIGKTNEVLFERRDKNGFFTGHTTDFLKVKVETSEDLSNQIKKVKIEKLINNELFASLV